MRSNGEVWQGPNGKLIPYTASLTGENLDKYRIHRAILMPNRFRGGAGDKAVLKLLPYCRFGFVGQVLYSSNRGRDVSARCVMAVCRRAGRIF